MRINRQDRREDRFRPVPVTKVHPVGEQNWNKPTELSEADFQQSQSRLNRPPAEPPVILEYDRRRSRMFRTSGMPEIKPERLPDPIPFVDPRPGAPFEHGYNLHNIPIDGHVFRRSEPEPEPESPSPSPSD